MSLQAPTVVVADQRNDALVTALRAHDRAPVVECTWQQAAGIIKKSWPSAVIFDDPVTEPRAVFARAIAERRAAVALLDTVGDVEALVVANELPVEAAAPKAPRPEPPDLRVLRAERPRAPEPVGVPPLKTVWPTSRNGTE